MPGLPRPIFKAGLVACFRRLLLWAWVVVDVVGGRLWDQVRGRDSIDRRARRLRSTLEQAGGTFVKLGQQISMRIDLVPWDYCVELSKMFDLMPPFPVEEALEAIERAARRPWQDVFRIFDPVPVGSASIACVYQAELKDGSKVAVKVRRPGIGRVFMADLRILGWLLRVAEFLTIVRPGFTGHFRRDLRETLLEELDFMREGHFQDIFRREAGKHAATRFFTAPRVYFELSNQEVLVQEFASGMWLREVLSAVEQNDPAGHAMMRSLGIDPASVARNVLRAGFWGMSENLFFHADPHPANIVVGPAGMLTFIDFGSCGSYNEEQRWATERTVACMRRGDVEGMSRATLRLFEPFPPMDITPLMREARAENSRVLRTFGTKARYTHWWERTSAAQWLAVLKATRQYYVPVNLNTLRIIRATLLYDTLALRLDGTIDRFQVYHEFRRELGRFARRRARRRLRDTVREAAVRLEELAETAEELIERAQHTLSSPVAEFASLIAKGIFVLASLGRTAWSLAVVTAAAGAVVAAGQYIRTGSTDAATVLVSLRGNTVYAVVMIAVAVLNVRQILFRIRDREVGR
jgi:ubiquinone biosynthesis protein